jgi:hypothetical protein
MTSETEIKAEQPLDKPPRPKRKAVLPSTENKAERAALKSRQLQLDLDADGKK